MVTEYALLTIDVARAAQFEAAVAAAAPLFRAADGCHRLALERVVENDAQYRLVVDWETCEHHTVQFRNSAAFGEWRRLVGEFFVLPPVVDHTVQVTRYF